MPCVYALVYRSMFVPLCGLHLIVIHYLAHLQVALKRLQCGNGMTEAYKKIDTQSINLCDLPYFSASRWARPLILIFTRAATISAQEDRDPTLSIHVLSM